MVSQPQRTHDLYLGFDTLFKPVWVYVTGGTEETFGIWVDVPSLLKVETLDTREEIMVRVTLKLIAFKK